MAVQSGAEEEEDKGGEEAGLDAGGEGLADRGEGEEDGVAGLFGDEDAGMGYGDGVEGAGCEGEGEELDVQVDVLGDFLVDVGVEALGVEAREVLQSCFWVEGREKSGRRR